MEFLRQTIDTARLRSVFDLPVSLRDYSRLEVTIKPPAGTGDSRREARAARAARDVEIINRNAARFCGDAEENLLFQAAL